MGLASQQSAVENGSNSFMLTVPAMSRCSGMIGQILALAKLPSTHWALPVGTRFRDLKQPPFHGVKTLQAWATHQIK